MNVKLLCMFSVSLFLALSSLSSASPAYETDAEFLSCNWNLSGMALDPASAKGVSPLLIERNSQRQMFLSTTDGNDQCPAMQVQIKMNSTESCPIRNFEVQGRASCKGQWTSWKNINHSSIKTHGVEIDFSCAPTTRPYAFLPSVHPTGMAEVFGNPPYFADYFVWDSGHEVCVVGSIALAAEAVKRLGKLPTPETLKVYADRFEFRVHHQEYVDEQGDGYVFRRGHVVPGVYDGTISVSKCANP